MQELGPSGIAYAPAVGLIRDSSVSVMLGRSVERMNKQTQAAEEDVFIGWGQKINSQEARVKAKQQGRPFITLEDGFIAYLGHPALGGARVSMSLDHETLFYDASNPSRLEGLISQRAAKPLSDDVKKQAQDLQRRIRTIGATKYNMIARRAETANAGKTILIVDQTLGDRAISYGLATSDAFDRAVIAAVSDYPDHTILVRTHPDVTAGVKESAVAPALKRLPADVLSRVQITSEPENPYDLFDRVDAVYCVTSQLGFEALIAGKKVVTFAWPFYAGWGVTDDRAEKPTELGERRNQKASVEALMLATLIDYVRYCDPYQMQQCDLDRILDLIEADLSIAGPSPNTRLRKIGFSLWKYSFIGAFLPHAGIRPKKQSGSHSDTLIWGRKSFNTTKHSGRVWRMEDGFIRSVGLGSDLKRPASLVVDGSGIYYDATGPSDLENWLNKSSLSPESYERARSLRSALLNARVSKYNVGEKRRLGFRDAAGARPIILVPGQVESDASIQYGSPQIKTNTDLLKAVRLANPDAFIVYKPHPDVLSGNRAGERVDMAGVADWLVTDADILDCFDAVDEVHTLTSLAGFEALMRGIPVTCYGLPFYAGWGLTTDHQKTDRRNQKLTIEHLVYGALIAYPRYYSWQKRRAVGPEEILAEIEIIRSQRSSASSPSWLKRQVMKFYFLFEALLRY